MDKPRTIVWEVNPSFSCLLNRNVRLKWLQAFKLPLTDLEAYAASCSKELRLRAYDGPMYMVLLPSAGYHQV